MNIETLDKLLNSLVKSAFGEKADTNLVQLPYQANPIFYIMLSYELKYYNNIEQNIDMIREQLHKFPLIEYYTQPLENKIKELEKQVSELTVYKNYVDVQKTIGSINVVSMPIPNNTAMLVSDVDSVTVEHLTDTPED